MIYIEKCPYIEESLYRNYEDYIGKCMKKDQVVKNKLKKYCDAKTGMYCVLTKSQVLKKLKIKNKIN